MLYLIALCLAMDRVATTRVVLLLHFLGLPLL